MGKNILFIEDDQDIRESLQEFLALEGHKVTIAENGKKGFEKLQEMEALPELILLDLFMPEINGIDFIQMMQSCPQFKKIPIVIISAYPQRQIQATLKTKNHSYQYVKKPINIEELLSTIHKIHF